MLELLPCFEIEPREPATGAVLWMHGLGANGRDFEEIVPLLRQPRVRFVFPHAPARPVTINGGFVMPAWYDILSLSAPRNRESERDVRASARQIEALIAREEGRGVPPERLVIAGFSQGGAMALFVGERYSRPLCGIMVLSGYEVLSESAAAEQNRANAATPLLFCHGRWDPVVPIAKAREAQEARAADGRSVAWHEFGMAHEMSIEEIDVVRDWLGERFGAA